MNGELSTVPIVVWVLIMCALLIQGIWMFNDAAKRGMNKWLWGILGLMNIPSNLIIYLIVSRRIIGVKKCHSCNKKINKSFKYCPHCGKIDE